MEIKVKFVKLDDERSNENIIGAVNDKEYKFRKTYENKISGDINYDKLVENLTGNTPNCTFNISEIEDAFNDLEKIQLEKDKIKFDELAESEWETMHNEFKNFPLNDETKDITLISKEDYLASQTFKKGSPNNKPTSPSIKYKVTKFSDELQKDVVLTFSINKEFLNNRYSWRFDSNKYKLIIESIVLNDNEDDWVSKHSYGINKGVVKKPLTILSKCDTYIKEYVENIKKRADDTRRFAKMKSEEDEFKASIEKDYDLQKSYSWEKEIKIKVGNVEDYKHIRVSQHKDKIMFDTNVAITRSQLKKIYDILSETN